MAWFLALCVVTAFVFLLAVYGILRSMKVDITPKKEVAQPDKEHFTCWNCGTGDWHRSWDPVEDGMTSYKRASLGLGLCPNCSGAD